MKLVRIIHDISQPIEFIVLDEFFRMTGIYVQEQKILKNINHLDNSTYWGVGSSKKLDDRNYDATLWICAHKEEPIEREYALERGYIPVGAFESLVKQQNDTAQFLFDALRSLEEQTALIEDIALLRKLVSTYIKFDLYMHSFNIRYYYSTNLNEYLRAYMGAYNEIMQEAYSGQYSVYFKLCCAQKVNEVCDRLKTIREYSGIRLLTEALELAGQYPEWQSAWGLAANLAKQEPSRVQEVPVYYMKNDDKQNEYNSYNYYSLGKFYEQRRASEEITVRCYQRSYDIDPTNYRALYKVAIFSEKNQEYEKARNAYYQIIQMLEPIAKAFMIQPMEAEYLIKAYYRNIRITRVNLDCPKAALQIIEEALKLKDVLEENQFFKYFYSEEEFRSRLVEIMNDRLLFYDIEKERNIIIGYTI